MAANENATSRDQRGMSRTFPLLGITSQLDDGTWLTTALDGREYGPFRFRPEATEVLLLVAIFPSDGMTADQTRDAT